RRQHLPEERPDRDRPEERAEPERQSARAAGQPEAECREDEVDESAVRVVPGAIRQPGPGDRGAEPRNEQSERQERPPATRESACRSGEDDCRRRTAAEPPDRAVTRAAAEEEREPDQRERCDERQVSAHLD